MARFYGWTDKYIRSLDWMVGEDYWHAITMIEAQEALIQMRIADYPHLKKRDREKMHRSMHDVAYPRNRDSVKRITTDELAKRVRMALNG